MSNSEAINFRQFEYDGWARAAETYTKYFPPLTKQTIPVLLGAISIKQGDHVLDVACGPGNVASAAYELGAHVTAVDFSPEMVAICKSLHPEIDVREGDAENLEFTDESFDGVVMNYGLLHLAQPEVAITEAHRVLRSGGRFAFSVWQTSDKARGFAVVLDSVAEFGDPSISLPPGPNFFAFSDDSFSQTALKKAGFKDVGSIEVDQVWVIPSAEVFFEAFSGGAARTGALLRAQPKDHLAKIKQSISDRLKEFKITDRFEIPMPSVVHHGTR